MAARLYRVPYTGTLTNAGGNTDLLSIEPADDKPVRLVGWILGQSSEFGDAAEESVRVTLRHMVATVTIGSGGSAVTPVANRPGTADVVAAGFTARCNDTTVATTSGTSTIMEELGWNIRSSPWERWIPEELRPVAFQTEAIIVRLESTLTDDVTGELTFFVEELA
jgi:hypothetical protein